MSIDLAAPDDAGNPPERRIKDYDAANRLYTVLREADDIPARNRDLVHRLMAGEPPRDQAALDDAGLGDCCNVNWLKAQADRDQAVTTFVGLVDATPVLINVRTNYGDKSLRADWEAAINEEYTWLMRERWSPFYDREQNKAVSLVSNGLALAYWPHSVDWRSEVGEPGQFLFPSDASTDVDKWELVVQVETVQAAKLYEKLKNHDVVVDKGDDKGDGPKINKAAVLQAIKDACKSEANSIISKDIYERFRGNDLCETYARSQEIRLVHYYVTEYSGKVSHYVGRADGKGPGFLEEHLDGLDSMSDTFVPYADGVGEGKLSSLQGFIWRAYPSYQADNELRNRGHDALKAALICFIQAGRGSGARETLAQLTFNPFTVLPDGVTPVENKFSATALSSIFPLLNENAATIANNTGGYASHDFSPEGSEGRTATEANLQASNNAQISGAKVLNHSRATEKFHRVTFNRLKRKDYYTWQPGGVERQEWIRRLDARGVPIEALYGVYEVKAVRPIGLGSPVAMAQAFSVLNGKRPFMDPVGQRNLDRDMAAAAGVDYGTLNRYLPPLDVKRSTPDQVLAPLENGVFATGTPVPVYEDQDPYVHIPLHLPFFDNTQQLLQQGVIDLRQAVRETGPALEHVQQHLAAAKDPNRADEVKDWQKAFAAATKAFGGMKEQLQTQAPPVAAPGAPAPVDPKIAASNLIALGTARKDGLAVFPEQANAALVAMGLPPYPPGYGTVMTPQGPVSQPMTAPNDPAAVKLAESQANIQIASQESQATQARLDEEAQARIHRDNALTSAQNQREDLQKAADILPQVPAVAAPPAPTYTP